MEFIWDENKEKILFDIIKSYYPYIINLKAEFDGKFLIVSSDQSFDEYSKDCIYEIENTLNISVKNIVDIKGIKKVCYIFNDSD